MALNTNLVFSKTNLVDTATITCNLPSVTPLDWLKTSKRARQTRWANPNGNIEITTTFASVQNVDYVAIPGHDLGKASLPRVKFVMYDAGDAVLHDTGWLAVDSLIPAGAFKVGRDPFNVVDDPLTDVFFHYTGRIVDVAYVVTHIEHNYTYTAPPAPPNSTTISDGIFEQNATSGIVSVESESMAATSVGNDSWNVQNDAGASGGVTRYKTTSAFYNSNGAGPTLKFQFRAANTGLHKIWLRLKSNSQGNSIYTNFDATKKTSIFGDYAAFANNTYQWRNTASVNLVAGATHTVEIAARDRLMFFDKLVIAPSGDPAPTGNGPAESPTGTIIVEESGNEIPVTTLRYVNLRMLMIGELYQFDYDFDEGLDVQYIAGQSNYLTESGFTVSGRVPNFVRTANLTLPFMNATDRRELITLERELRGRPFLVNLYPQADEWTRQNHIFLGKFEAEINFIHKGPELYSASLTINEV